MNGRGSVLMVVVWILALLVVFSVGVGHRAAVHLKLSGLQRDKVKAYFLAKAGLRQAIHLAQEDIKEASSAKNYDTMQECGVDLAGRPAADVFSGAFEEDGRFVVGYEDKGKNFRYGPADEAGRLNINGIAELKKKAVWLEFLKLKGIEETESLAEILVDWTDENKVTAQGGTEDEVFKNAALSVPEELLMALEYFCGKNGLPQDRAAEMFSLIASDAGVCSQKVNINTASGDVLTALARSSAYDLKDQGVTLEHADTLAAKMTDFRDGEDNVFGTPDDGIFKEVSAVAADLKDLAPQEALIVTEMSGQLAVKSHCLRVVSTGTAGRTIKKIEVLYDREGGRIAAWREG